MFFKRLVKRRRLFVLGLVIAAILIVFLGAKVYLYTNFLLGNDIIVKLSSDKEYIYFTHKDEATVEFESKVTTNPFCSAVCTSKFIDVNTGAILDQNRFLIKPGSPYKQAYNIKAKDKGIGKDFYSYDLECESSGRFLCHSDFETSSRNILITAEYDFTDEEKILKESFESNSESLADEIALMKADVVSLKNAFKDFNKTVTVDFNFTYEEGLGEIKESLVSVASQEGYFLHTSELVSLREKFNEVYFDFFIFRDAILENISDYNEIIDNIITAREFFENATYSSEEEFNHIKNLSEEFILAVEVFSLRNNLKAKKDFVDEILIKINASNLSQFGEKINVSELGLKEINFTKIEVKKVEKEGFDLEFFIYEPMCCIKNECNKCCVGNECRNNAEAFPVVFLHGHSITKELPLEFSLEGFKDIQDNLEKEGFLNVGAITLYTKKDVPAGIWNFNFPITIRGSYYFDLFDEPENYKVILTKSENIDTYAVRLKEVFDNIRFRTGKNKVNVVAFSMGGLVVRRHMQLFGSDGFDKIILIGTPNKGISGDVSTFCPLIGGEKRECNDMSSESLFMQKLNRDKVPDNIYNIYATGCDMSEGLGDGIVLEEKAKLDIENNFVINGTCRSKFRPLHLDLLKNNGVFEIIKNILKENEIY